MCLFPRRDGLSRRRGDFGSGDFLDGDDDEDDEDAAAANDDLNDDGGGDSGMDKSFEEAASRLAFFATRTLSAS